MSEIKFSKIEVELLDTMGTDLDVVNAARISFGTNHTEWDVKDDKLITRLGECGHWTPYSHVYLKFRIKAPIYVARQLVKHRMGCAWNELSRRYSAKNIEFFMPTLYMKDGDNIKALQFNETYCNSLKASYEVYEKLLNAGVKAEDARGVLPVNTMTEWIWSGSLYFFMRVCKLRMNSHAQHESQFVAQKIFEHLKEKFPKSIESQFHD